MGKKLWSILPMVMVVTMLLFVISCANKAVAPEPAETLESEAQPLETEMDTMTEPLTDDTAGLERYDGQQEQQPIGNEADHRPSRAEVEAFMAEDIHYDYNSASLDKKALEILNRKAEWLLNNPGVSVIIEGHTDERRSSERNIMLGENRAGNVKGYLISRGIDPARLTAVSYGEERPVDPGHTEAAWRKNRRVHFVVNTGE